MPYACCVGALCLPAGHEQTRHLAAQLSPAPPAPFCATQKQMGCSREDIRRAFRRRALRCHPDKNQQDPVGAAAAFRQLASAYQTLVGPSASCFGSSAGGMEDVEEGLTEEFFSEAFAQDLPPFELLFM